MHDTIDAVFIGTWMQFQIAAGHVGGRLWNTSHYQRRCRRTKPSLYIVGASESAVCKGNQFSFCKIKKVSRLNSKQTLFSKYYYGPMVHAYVNGLRGWSRSLHHERVSCIWTYLFNVKYTIFSGCCCCCSCVYLRPVCGHSYFEVYRRSSWNKMLRYPTVPRG